MFKKDSMQTGLIIGLGSILIISGLIYLIFTLLKIPLQGNMRFFLLAFVPDILLLRYYIKNLRYMRTGKALAAIVCLLMLVVIIALFKMGEL